MAYFSSNYNEFIGAIPFVRPCNNASSSETSVASVLFLDNEMAVLGGRVFYNMPKHFSRIRVDNPERMGSVSIETLVTEAQLATFSSSVDWNSSALPFSKVKNNIQVKNMIHVFDLVMRQRLDSENHLCSTMTFDFQNATFRSPTSVQIVTEKNSVPGLLKSKFVTSGFLSSSTASSSIFFEADWRMGKPLQSC